MRRSGRLADILLQRSDELAAGFTQAGIGPGQRIGMLMRNRLEYAEAMLGAMKIGATVVLLNIRNTAHEMRHPVTDADLDLIIADSEFLPLLEGVGSYAPKARVVTSEPVEGYPLLADLRGVAAEAPTYLISGEDIALICYTSGTTGVPKGAMLSHGAIYSAGAAIAFSSGHGRHDRMLLPMLLSYTGGCVFFLRDGVVAGASTFLLSRPTAETMLATIEREKITCVQSVGVMFDMMMNHARFADTDMSHLRRAATGGSSISLHQLQTWQDRGIPLIQGYGQTESAGSHIALLNADEAVRKIGFAGRPMPNLEVRIVGEDGEDLAPNMAGEIWVRGAAIMSGYLNRPEESAAALEGGWLHTGDIGLLDEEGYLKIVDRTKDMLISGGLNVYPAEIEKALAGLPGLEEMCVIGVPDPRWGEVPMIISSTIEGLDLDRLARSCVELLADYKRPRWIVGHPEPLPRTYSDKITKPQLRKLYGEVPTAAIEIPFRKAMAQRAG